MINENEKRYLKALAEKDLERLKKEEGSVITDISPAFLKAEAEYEDFIKALIKKLK